MPNTALNRSEVLLLTNKSGGAVAQGDTVVMSTGTANAFTTTTSAAFTTGSVGIVVEPNGIANDAVGLVAFAGYAPKSNLSASANLGDFIATHTVAKQSAPHAAPGAAGDFGQVLGTGTSPAILLFGSPKISGAAGAPSTAEYVTTAADAGLSAEVAIPGLAGSADIASAGGAGTSEEYDTSTTGLAWDVAPAVVDSDTTVKSHLYVQTTAGQNIGTKAWAPAGAFDARAKISIANNALGKGHDMALHIQNSDATVRVHCGMSRAANTYAFKVQAYSYASATYTQRGNDWTTPSGNQIYVRITRDGSNNVSWYWSANGILWQFITTLALTFTVAKIGFRLSGDTVSNTMEGVADWLRTDV